MLIEGVFSQKPLIIQCEHLVLWESIRSKETVQEQLLHFLALNCLVISYKYPSPI